MEKNIFTKRFSPLPTFGGVIFIIYSLLIFLNGEFLLTEGDTAWIIRTGEYIIQTGTVPSHDLYSYTCPDLPWVVYQWGFMVLVASAYKIAGFHGVVWLCSIIIASLMLLFFKLLRAIGSSILVAFPLTLLATTVATYDWDVRPGIVTQLLFITTLFILQKYKSTSDTRILYSLPLIFLVWANTHLGFIVGFVAIGFTILERYLCFISEKDSVSRAKERRAIVVLVGLLGVSLLVTLINPNSYKLIPYFLRIADAQQNDYIMELKSPNFHSHILISFQLMLIVLIASLAFLPRKAELGTLLMTFVFLIASLHSIRLSPFFAFLSCIVIAQQVNPIFIPDPKKTQANPSITEKLYARLRRFDELEEIFGSWILPLLVSIVVTLTVMSGYTSRIVDLSFSKKNFPVEACNFAMQHGLPGNLYSSGYWGSYAIFSLYPKYKVFIDTRFDMYGDKIFFEVLECEYLTRYESVDVHAGDPNKIFDKYQVNWVLTGKESLLAIFLKKDMWWLEIHSDEVALIFLRNNHANSLWLKENLRASSAK
ncbi:MAG TPA: hypothetical protein ACFYD3_02770 [Candidatus Hypogeohydataceae bacterium YC41]